MAETVTRKEKYNGVQLRTRNVSEHDAAGINCPSACKAFCYGTTFQRTRNSSRIKPAKPLFRVDYPKRLPDASILQITPLYTQALRLSLESSLKEDNNIPVSIVYCKRCK
jgi:hypothetical protein